MLTHSWLYFCFYLVCCLITCCKIIIKSMQGVTSLSVMSKEYTFHEIQPLIYTDLVTPNDTVLLKPVKTPSELHTSLDRGENQIWLDWVIPSSSPTERRAQVDVLLSSTMDSTCSELSGVGFMFWTPHSSRTPSWSSRMLVREPCCVAATSSTVTH